MQRISFSDVGVSLASSTKFLLRFWSLVSLCFCILFLGYAASAANKKKSPRIRVYKARVVKEGVAVYKGPSFDAPIIGYLEGGKKIPARRKVYPGLGGFGAFYKVKLKKRVFGYVADTDIAFPGSKEDEDAGDGMPWGDSRKDFEDNRPSINEPIFFTRYFGLSGGTVDFTEKVAGKKFHSQTTIFGLKLTGPDTLSLGPPLDINIMFAPSPPKFYELIVDEETKPKGFIVVGDMFFNMPFMDWGKGMVFMGLGLVVNYTNYTIVIDEDAFDSQEVRMGAAVNFGLAQQLTPIVALRAEGKYYYETEGYMSFVGSLLFRY
jgi:hypothetical protein